MNGYELGAQLFVSLIKTNASVRGLTPLLAIDEEGNQDEHGRRIRYWTVSKR